MNLFLGGAPQIYDLSRAIPGQAGDNFAKGKVTFWRRREACRGTSTDEGAKPEVSRSGALRQTGLEAALPLAKLVSPKAKLPTARIGDSRRGTAESKIQASHRQRRRGEFRQARYAIYFVKVPKGKTRKFAPGDTNFLTER